MNNWKLARYMHERYEIYAVETGWKTQESCQVNFNKLPEANKKVMLKVAQDVIDFLKREENAR